MRSDRTFRPPGQQHDPTQPSTEDAPLLTADDIRNAPVLPIEEQRKLAPENIAILDNLSSSPLYREVLGAELVHQLTLARAYLARLAREGEEKR